MLTLLTESRGVVGASASRARRGSRVVVEPMHTLRVTLEERVGAELLRLRDSEVETARLRLTARLDALASAGKALRWARALLPPLVREPHAWVALVELLDKLDAPVAVDPTSALATAGLQLVEAAGWGFELRACVRCGAPCPEARAGHFDPRRGGLVCRACGAARRVLSGAERVAIEAARDGGLDLPSIELATDVVAWIDAALEAHAMVAPRA